MSLQSQVDEQYAILTRGAIPKGPDALEGGVITEPELREKIETSVKSGKPLNIYAGFDPTSDSLTVGHLPVIRRLNAAAELGHNVTFLTGRATVAWGGDPSGRDEAREQLSWDIINNNYKRIKNQAQKILHSGINIRDNYEWFQKIGFRGVADLLRTFTHDQLRQAAFISGRDDRKQPYHLTEMAYPLIMAPDSLELQADVQYGGLDQLFNLGICRTHLKRHGQEPLSLIALKMLGLKKGEKISKSDPRTYLPIDTPPERLYKAIARMDVNVIPTWLELFTDMSYDDIGQWVERINTFDTTKGVPEDLNEIKQYIASEVLSQIYPGKSQVISKANQAFLNGNITYQHPIRQNVTIVDLVGGAIRSDPDMVAKYGKSGEVSNSAVIRLINDGAVRISGERIQDKNAVFNNGELPKYLAVGKQFHIDVSYKR